MKKIKGLILVVMILLTTGCSSELSTFSSGKSESELEADTLALINDLYESKDDYETYSSYFVDSTQEPINLFSDSADTGLNRGYHNFQVVAEYPEDDFYFVAVQYYDVAGVHPNTQHESNSYSLPIKYIDGEAKIYMNEEYSKDIDYTDIYPQDVLEADEAGRNSMMFDTGDYMYLENEVYENAMVNSVKFASQNEDGSVTVYVYFANGTNQNIYLKNGTIQLEDDTLGTILDASINIEEFVNAGEGKMLSWTFGPEQITTGTTPWTSINSHIHVSYD